MPRIKKLAGVLGGFALLFLANRWRTRPSTAVALDGSKLSNSAETDSPDSPETTPKAAWYEDPSFFENPFVYTPIKREDPVRILFMSSLEDSMTRIDTFLYETYDAAQRHPYIEPYFWGPGYKGYWDKDNLASNLERKFGCGYFDIVYMHQGQPPIADEFDDVHSLGCGTLLITKTGDCNNNQCVWESSLFHGNVTVLRYAHEAFEMFSYDQVNAMKKRKYSDRPDMSYQLFAHVPDTANEWDFYPVDNWSDKKEDVVMYGKVDAAYYPIRITISEAIKYGLTFIKKHVAPPPFLLAGSEVQVVLDARIPTLEWHRRRHDPQRNVLKVFAQSLRETKICVFDGSVEQKAIRKFAQVMLSGCVIASDLVTEHDHEMKDFIIELGLYDDIFDINRKLHEALGNETELQRKSSAALSYARKHLTGLRELDLVIELANRYRAGERGYVFPNGFTSKCRRYHQFDHPELQWVPPWCRGEDFPLHDDWQPPGNYTWNGPMFDQRGFILPEHQRDIEGYLKQEEVDNGEMDDGVQIERGRVDM